MAVADRVRCRENILVYLLERGAKSQAKGHTLWISQGIELDQARLIHSSQEKQSP